MENSKTQNSKWQHWLSFSAFTLAGVAMEGSLSAITNPPPQPAPKAKKWRGIQ
ncbi:hypothetical protein K5Y32_14325 [Pantoea sp. DY-15]|jgi:hypothetical protein|uniref:hypothetical protein n=1 Tax=Pantoea TaxID=53335 RepID=UPI00142E0585|nr:MULTISPECIES: hypothetical protein [Pantoea]MBY4839532.1 hypothetical protein [Pantoea sp. DY-5]MBY4889120.1 hypothetical protein [Pantoea sp. DY-15]